MLGGVYDWSWSGIMGLNDGFRGYRATIGSNRKLQWIYALTVVTDMDSAESEDEPIAEILEPSAEGAESIRYFR